MARLELDNQTNPFIHQLLRQTGENIYPDRESRFYRVSLADGKNTELVMVDKTGVEASTQVIEAFLALIEEYKQTVSGKGFFLRPETKDPKPESENPIRFPTWKKESGTPIEQLDSSVRVHNSLKRAGIEYVEEIEAILSQPGGKETLLAFRDYGSKSLDETLTKLEKWQKAHRHFAISEG